MKNKRLHHRAILLLLLLLVLSFAIGLRITRLNGSYLATEDCYGYPQKPIEWNGLKIELIGAEIVDGEAFLQEYNIDRESIFSDSLSEKYALFHISVTKVSDSPLLKPSNFMLQPQPEKKVDTDEILNLEQLERHAVERAMKRSEGNLSRAAEYLGITRYALYRKLEKK